MTGHHKLAVTLVAVLTLGALVAPPLAGGAGAGGASPDAIALPGEQQIVVRVGNPIVRGSGNGLAFGARSTAMLRGRVRIAGTAPRTGGGVRIEREDAQSGWMPIARAEVADDGSFRTVWRPDRTGPVRLRALVDAVGTAAGEPTVEPALDATAPHLDVTVYRPGVASWYGPTRGEWSTACGVPLLPTTLGVAHRTLPCGTSVAFYYRGRTVVVPVIDRGPFVRGRTWDLTRAAHTALGATEGLVTVGALPLLPAAAPARSR
ncbi:MAG TPA: septal ring lytic transglycosylase RlpA family protein [Conexibacter sp.]|nr:septal ring lytic transglycosylase RlpA family protein [Conexibacter sp.]